MKTPRPAVALAVAVSFFAQTTGAADLAFVAVRPAPGALPPRALVSAHAPAGKVSPGTLARKSAGGPSSLSARARAYLLDARSVIAWLLTPDAAPALPPARTMPRASPKAAPAEAPQAAPEPPRDRMLLAKDPEFVGAADALSGALGGIPEAGAGAGVMAFRLETVELPWVQEDGFRLRLVYLGALGTTRGSARGFEVRYQGLPPKFVRAPVPAALRRLAPLYMRSMRVIFRVEVQAQRDLAGFTVSARQEELDGTPLLPFTPVALPALKAGETAAVDSDVPMLGRGQGGAVNFERTHVRVTSADGRVAADEPAAGLVDPPGR